MRSKRVVRMATASVFAAILTACNLNVVRAPEPTADVNALYTAAAGTLIAQYSDQQTQTAAANSPTPAVSPTPLASFTPLPTFPIGLTPFGTLTFGTPGVGLTPLATIPVAITPGYAVGCNNAVLIGESPKDGAKMEPQKVFKKSWSMYNTGTCTWGEGYSFAFKEGERLSGSDIKITTQDDATKPNHSQAFVITMQTPRLSGEYKGYWQMKDSAGNWFGDRVWVDIIVE